MPDGGGGDISIKIGLETHVQLNTATKAFCGCKNPVNLSSEAEPNTLTCPVCLGLPGSKPSTNRRFVELAAKVALALGAKIAKETFFSRKTYFYPDMSKNFQITQYELPLAREAALEIQIDEKKTIRIRRIHMEEDPAKLVHMSAGYTLVDYNRAGVPLIEIVTEPDFTSPKEARIYLQKLGMILSYLGVYDPTSDASMKTDGNISIEGGERVELKNVTGTKEIERALTYEALRQKNVLRRGIKIVQETRAWNPDLGVSQAMRTKETEEDYGYIFEPDLSRISVGESLKKKLSGEIPELPDTKRARFVKDYKVSEKMAESLTSERELADLFEEAVSKKIKTDIAATWVGIVLAKTLNYNNLTLKKSGMHSEWIIELVAAFQRGEYADRTAEKILRKMVDDKCDYRAAAKSGGFLKLGETADTGELAKKVVLANKKAADDYRGGQEKALNFLIGQLIKETRGAIDAESAKKEILKQIH